MNKKNYKHGLTYHPLYKVWYNMLYRCLKSNHVYYKNYGGRGITVCGEWYYIVNFIEWALKNGWRRGLYFDRINNDGNYEPSNCRFIDSGLNSRNKRLLDSTNKSGYRGVSFNKEKNKYVCQIMVDNKPNFLGYFNSPRLAAIRYDVEAYLSNDGRPTNFN